MPGDWLNKILIGDSLEILKSLPEGSVHTCITSPPYWGLRDYGSEGQIGLERLPEEYVQKLVSIFREVRRVLREDGTLWLNLGDCYATGAGKVGDHPGGGQQGERWKGYRGTHKADKSGKEADRIDAMGPMTQPNRMPIPGLKPKDLVGIPWMVAFALRTDGWWLRSDVIWAKQNCMPESVRDRPTKSHEYVFLFAKSEGYFYDSDAIREPFDMKPQRRLIQRNSERDKAMRADKKYQYELRDEPIIDGNPAGRNKRTVWSIATNPFPEAHFATFPEELVHPCILAGTSEKGCCASCGACWERVIEKPRPEGDGKEPTPSERDGGLTVQDGLERTGMSHFKYNEWLKEHPPKTVGWQKTCKCKGDDIAPCVVLDPFMGAGTTALVALREKRNFVGMEINPKYAQIAEGRIAQERAQLKLF